MAGFEVHAQNAALGAEIRGVDLNAPSDSDIEKIHGALLENQVLFFRDTELSDEAHMAFANRFGQQSIFPLLKLMGHTEPSFQTLRDDETSLPGADDWHTDVTWTPEPPKMAFLRSTIVPDFGGDTMWGSMTAAYDALSPSLQAFFDGLTVLHDCESFIRGMELKMGHAGAHESGLAGKLRAGYPPVEHPLIRTHPDTGRKAIYYGGGFMRRIVGLQPHESDGVLNLLASHVTQPHFHFRWKWRVGDLAMWDERCTVHRALGNHYPRLREVRRCVVDGDRPY